MRYAEVEREFDQARVQVVLDIDGGGRQDVSTGIGFFDHVLKQFGHFGFLNLGIKAEGDLIVDDLHTMSAVGNTLGRALRETLRESEPIVRFAESSIVLEDALVSVAVDLQGRGSFISTICTGRDKIGEASSENLIDFFSIFCSTAGISANVRQLSGSNSHHIFEALFIAFGTALHLATRVEDSRNAPVSKGKMV